MIKLRLILSLIAAVLVAGCATTGPIYSPPTAGQTATIKGGNANIVKFFTGADCHVAIVEVDGLTTPESFWTGRAGAVVVSPGERSVTVLLSGRDYTQAQETIVTNFEAGKIYQLSARLVGIEFDFRIQEEGGSGELGEPVFSKRIMGGRSPGPAYIPIIIPAG